jgi:serine/threonine protein kinase
VPGALKPANIFKTKFGQTKLPDFGLAKLKEAKQRQNRPQPSAGSQPVDQLGIVGGDGCLCRPNRRSDLLDSRSDLFSLGVVLTRWRPVCILLPALRRRWSSTGFSTIRQLRRSRSLRSFPQSLHKFGTRRWKKTATYAARQLPSFAPT